MFIIFGILKGVFADVNLIFNLLMLGASILGNFFMNAWFCLTLSIFLWENKVSRYVIMSVLDHLDQLGVTIILGIIVFYWYSVVTFFSSWRGDYVFNEDRLNSGTAVIINLSDY